MARSKHNGNPQSFREASSPQLLSIFCGSKKASALPALHSLLHFLFLASKMDEEVGKPSCKPVKYFDEMFILCMNQSEVSNSF